MHPVYRNFVLSKITGAVAASRAATLVQHDGLKGQIREIVIRDLLRPLLPSDIGVGSGEVVSHTGETSTQQDVILYDRAILPPVVFEQSIGLFPIESVLYTIEVKTELDVKGLKLAHAAASKLLGFRYAAGTYGADATPREHRITKAIAAVFAFDTSIGNADVLGKYKEHLAEEAQAGRSGTPSLRAICVAGKGYWYQENSTWKTWQSRDEYHEVLGFLSGIMNTYKEVAATRQRPRLGYYLVDLERADEPSREVE